MTADRALDILAMSEQARWRDGIEPEDVDKAVETIRKALRSKLSVDVLDKIKAEIEPKCDRINSLASALPYTAHREIQELLCEIMDLCKAEREVEECIKNG